MYFHLNRKLLFLCTLFILSFSVCLTAAEECVEYHRDSSYIDPTTNHMILRFFNRCNEGHMVNVCIYNEEGAENRFSQWVPPANTVDIDVGVRIPNQNFWWSVDSTAPCAKETKA